MFRIESLASSVPHLYCQPTQLRFSTNHYSPGFARCDDIFLSFQAFATMSHTTHSTVLLCIQSEVQSFVCRFFLFLSRFHSHLYTAPHLWTWIWILAGILYALPFTMHSFPLSFSFLLDAVKYLCVRMNFIVDEFTTNWHFSVVFGIIFRSSLGEKKLWIKENRGKNRTLLIILQCTHHEFKWQWTELHKCFSR